MVAAVVEALVASGAIPKNKVRNELMDVRPMLSPHFKDPPLLRIERAAMIKFGAYRILRGMGSSCLIFFYDGC
jgi:hypothetical protein